MELLDNFIKNLDYLKSELPLLMRLKDELSEYLSRYQRPDDAIVSFFDSLNDEDFEIKAEEIEELQNILDKYANSEIPVFISLYKESKTLKEMVDKINDTADSLRSLENIFTLNSKFFEYLHELFIGINFRFINTTIYQYFDRGKVKSTVADSVLISSETMNIVVVDRYGYSEDEIKKKMFFQASDQYLSYIIINGKISYERNFNLLKGKRVQIKEIIKPQEL